VSERDVILGVVALFTLFFATLTVYAAVDQGITIGTVVSVVVLGLFGIALAGLISHRPDE
jgi:hypothetical protein